MNRTCAIILSLLLPFSLSGELIISEFMASNRSGLTDEDGDTSDWIEIHNPTSETANLNSWHLTDDVENLTKWTFPSTPLAPGGYFVVYASGKDRAQPSGQLHTNFRLSADGEYLGLVEPDGTTIHRISHTRIRPRCRMSPTAFACPARLWPFSAERRRESRIQWVTPV